MVTLVTCWAWLRRKASWSGATYPAPDEQAHSVGRWPQAPNRQSTSRAQQLLPSAATLDHRLAESGGSQTDIRGGGSRCGTRVSNCGPLTTVSSSEKRSRMLRLVEPEVRASHAAREDPGQSVFLRIGRDYSLVDRRAQAAMSCGSLCLRSVTGVPNWPHEHRSQWTRHGRRGALTTAFPQIVGWPQVPQRSNPAMEDPVTSRESFRPCP